MQLAEDGYESTMFSITLDRRVYHLQVYQVLTSKSNSKYFLPFGYGLNFVLHEQAVVALQKSTPIEPKNRN